MKQEIPKFKLITSLLEMVKETDNEYIKIAKGKYKIPKTFKDIVKTARRNKKQ